MFRIFEDKESKKDDLIFLSKKNSHHLLKVVRLGKEEVFEIVLEGKLYDAKIIEGGNHPKAKIVREKIQKEDGPRIHLYQGLPKSDKFELIIQKTCELGISEITPFTSSRTIVKWDGKKAKKKLERYREISLSASEQSKRISVAKINNLIDFESLGEEIEKKFTLLAYENAGGNLRKELENKPKDISIIVGPEGGFSDGEIGFLMKKGARLINLGDRIMRTETCAIALTAIVQYESGDLDEKI